MKVFNGASKLTEYSAPWSDPILENYNVAVFVDHYPCTPGHLLFVPKFNTIETLNIAFDYAIKFGKDKVKTKEWDGFNVGMNFGKAAGQTVEWPHIHLIPRKQGDVEDPTGGIRNTIPGKGNYKEHHEQN